MNNLWLKIGSFSSLFLSVLVLGAVWSFGITTEVPVGGLTGTVFMESNGNPLPNAEVIAYANFELPDDVKSSWVTRTNEKGEFTFRGLPSGLYSMNAYGQIHTNPDKIVAFVQEGKTEAIRIKTKRSYDELELHTNQRVFLPSEKPEFVLSGYTDVSSVNFQVFKVPYASVFDTRSPENLVRSLAANKNDKDPSKTAGLTSIFVEERNLARKDVEGHFVEQVRLNEQAEGLYLVKAVIGKEAKYAWVSVTKIALVTKSGNGKTLAFVTDLQSGNPIPNATVSYMSGTQLKPVGSTASDGTLSFATDPGTEETRVIVADNGSSRAFTWFYESNQASQGKTVLWAQTDRPVYRPGDLVQYKVVARDTVPSGYEVTKGTVEVEVTDSDETVIEKKELPLSADGTVHGSFRTDTQGMQNAYYIKLAHGTSSDSHVVSIVSYRKPEFRITVKPQKATYIRGESAKFNVHVETYTGEPGAGMEVRGWVYQKADWSFSPFGDEYDYDIEDYGSDYHGDAVQEVEGTTDEQGNCVISTPTAGKTGEETTLADATFTLEIDVQQTGGNSTQATGTAKVVRGEFNLTSEPSRFIIEPSESVDVKFNATWHDGSPAAGKSVDAEYGHYRWVKDESIFVSEGKSTVKLDEQGQGLLSLTPTVKGDFTVKLASRDSRGNIIGSQSSVWVQAGSGNYAGPVPELAVILDKANYKPGDVAKALIQARLPGGTALITIEADGILWSKTIKLEYASTTFDISGLSAFAPNAIVSVSYVREKEYFQATKSLKVDLVEKTVNVTVEPDRKKLGPGEAVTYKIRATDKDGNPVRANVALGVVDESIYAVAEDTDDPLRSFYPRRWSTVQSAYSFPILYLDGEDKNPRAVRIRKNFQDTAFWNPDITTDSTGNATAIVRLPDNLTEWRATATVFTSDTRIGKGRASVVVKKDLMARLSLPMFLIENDVQTVSARVSNTSERNQKVVVTMGATGAVLDGELQRTIDLGPDESQTLSWIAKVDQMGEAKFRVTAVEQGGAATDGVEQAVPIHVKGVHETSTAVGETTSEKTATVVLDPNAVNGTLRVSVSPTLLGTLVQALPGLIDYPYGCTEQTMSRFVPAVLVVDLMRKTGYHDRESESRLSKVTHDSLARVKRLQTSDGGWGWWEYDSPQEWMTAYVLEGLWRVSQVGVDTNSIAKDRAIDWAEQRLKTPDPQLTQEYRSQWADRIDLASAVLLYKASPVAKALLLRAAKVPNLPTQSLANLTLSLKRLGSDPALQKQTYERLISQADETRETMNWPNDGWYEPTAAALEAVATIEPNSPRLAKVFRYLQSVRKGDIWTSTRDTARVIVSATTYLQRTKELNVDEDVTIKINGREVMKHHFTRADLVATPRSIVVPFTALAKGQNTITFSAKGTGKVYYSASLDQDIRQTQMSAKNGEAGFSIKTGLFRATPFRLEDGTMRLVVSKTPINQARSGEVLRCRVTLTTQKTLSNVMIEVPIPSNTRIIDDEEPLDGMSWDWWWSRSVFRDEKAVFFGNITGGRPQIIEFALRAEAPGSSLALPATVCRMYQPGDKAMSDTISLEVIGK